MHVAYVLPNPAPPVEGTEVVATAGAEVATENGVHAELFTYCTVKRIASGFCLPWLRSA